MCKDFFQIQQNPLIHCGTREEKNVLIVSENYDSPQENVDQDCTFEFEAYPYSLLIISNICINRWPIKREKLIV